MIKFFRSIRQRLVVENRFSKYLLYAIGEIVLVVIGILIALQINNWNQQRIEDSKELELPIEAENPLCPSIIDPSAAPSAALPCEVILPANSAEPSVPFRYIWVPDRFLRYKAVLLLLS